MTLLIVRDADVYTPQALGVRDLLVGGGRVLWMDEGPLELPARLRGHATELALEGRRLVPGLVDAHAHVTGGGGEAGFATRVPPPALSHFTLAGVTTVVGLLGTDDVARGPTELLASVYALREQGLGAWAWAGGYHLPPATLSGSLRRDLVFIEALVGVGEVAISDHRSSQPTTNELRRVAADAHVAGLMTGKAGVVHLHVGDGAAGLEPVRAALHGTELPPRVFHPTHVNRRRALFDEAVELARAGSVVDVTAFPVDADEDAWPAAEAVRRFLDSGAPPAQLTVSSDAGGCLPCFDAEGRVEKMDVGRAGSLVETLRALLAMGVPLADALAPLTANPARLLRLPGKGRVAAGADADFLVLGADHGVDTVVIGGTVHARDGVALRRGAFED